jgi:hypothetical protein
MTLPARPLATITSDPVLGRDQHWAAESYLKRWRDPSTPQGAYLWVSPKDRSTAPRKRSPKKTFISADMNTMSKDGQRNLLLENLYQRFETSFGNIKDRLVSGTPLTNDDQGAIVDFVAAQLVRTPKFRKEWKLHAAGDHEAQLATISDPVLRVGVEQTLVNICNNQFQLLSFPALKSATELLQKLRMHLLHTNDRLGFITSDAPCCVVEYTDRVASIFEILASPTSNVVMPLSPDVLAIFDHSDRPHEMIGLFPNQPIVHEANAIIWKGAVKEVVLRRPTLRSEWFSESVANKLARYSVL